MAWFGNSREAPRPGVSGGAAPSEIAALDAYSQAVVNVVNKVGPAVVQIGVAKEVLRAAVSCAHGRGRWLGLHLHPRWLHPDQWPCRRWRQRITVTLADGHDLPAIWWA